MIKPDAHNEVFAVIPLDTAYREQCKRCMIASGAVAIAAIILLMWWQWSRGQIRDVSLTALIALSLLLVIFDVATSAYVSRKLRRCGAILSPQGITVVLPNDVRHLPVAPGSSITLRQTKRTWNLASPTAAHSIKVAAAAFPDMLQELRKHYRVRVENDRSLTL